MSKSSTQFLGVFLSGIVLMTAALIGNGPASAAGTADFYKGKVISIYVGNYPGGGYDAYSRALARDMGKHISGKPNLIVRNMPGASGLRAANFVYNTAPRDGTVMGVFAAGAVFAPLFGNKKAKFYTDKFSWIGNMERSIGTCAVWHTSGLRTFDQILNQPVIFGASGTTGTQSEFPRGFNALLGARIQVIHGYAGGTGTLLAMQRGEVQGGCATSLSTLKSVRRKDWKSGRLIVVVQLGLNKHPDLKGVQHVHDYAKSKSDKAVLELIYGRQTLGRPVAAPPAQPRVRTEALRAAFMATMTDPASVSSASGRRKLNIDPMNGAEVDRLIARFLSYPKDVVARARKAMKTGKVKKVKLKKLAGTIAKLTKKRIKVKGSDGKMHTFKLHSRRSKVKIGGNKAKTKALKTGMACTFRHYGEKDLVKRITCK
jgi:tripartite-type tricarboxylate transporter receptor subunit TctC